MLQRPTRDNLVANRFRSDTWANGNPSLGVDGPTNGKIKVDPKRRLGFYIVDPR